MAGRMAHPKFRSFLADGTPNSGGKVYTYENTTTTKTNTYTDRAAGTPNANPVILDAAGEGDIWWPPGVQYTVKIDTSADGELSSTDDLSVDDLSTWIATGSDVYYSAGKVFVGGSTGSEDLTVTGTASVSSTLAVTGVATFTAAIAAGLGVGIDRTEGTLHVHTATAGSVTANTAADDLVVENSGDAGISVLSPDASRSYVVLGSPTDNLGGYMRYDFSNLKMEIVPKSTATLHVGNVLGGNEQVVWDTKNKVTFVTAETTQASIVLPHGTAPTSPVNGDVWTTTAGLYAQINGSTVGPYTA